MAKQTGKSMGVLKKEMSKGTITYEEVAAAFQSVTSDGGKFYQMMEKQSESMGGKWSTLIGTFSSKMAELGLSMKGLVNPVLDFSISVISGNKINEKAQAITALQKYIAAQNEVSFSVKEREELIARFNSQFGEEVLGKTIAVEIALNKETFVKEFNELKAALEASQITLKQNDKKKELFEERSKLNEKIEDIKVEVFKKGAGFYDEPIFKPVSRTSDRLFDANKLKREGISYREKTSIPKFELSIAGVNNQLVQLILDSGVSTKEDVEVLKKRKTALTTPIEPPPWKPVLENHQALLSQLGQPPLKPALENQKALAPIGQPPWKPALENKETLLSLQGIDELIKINKALAKFTSSLKKESKEDPDKHPSEQKSKMSQLASSINTGGKTYKTVNLNISQLIGEMNNHFSEQEFTAEELEKMSINGLLRALNGAMRIAEA